MYATFQSNDSTRRFLIGGMAALILGIASTAGSASPTADGIQSVTVRYAGLDLSRSVGAQILYTRIQQAALQVCDGFVGPFREMRTKASPCYKDAVASAVAQVNSPQLSVIYRAHMPRLASN